MRPAHPFSPYVEGGFPEYCYWCLRPRVDHPENELTVSIRAAAVEATKAKTLYGHDPRNYLVQWLRQNFPEQAEEFWRVYTKSFPPLETEQEPTKWQPSPEDEAQMQAFQAATVARVEALYGRHGAPHAPLP